MTPNRRNNSLLLTLFLLCPLWGVASTVVVDESDPEVRRDIGDRFGPGSGGSYFAENGMVTSSSNQATFAGVEILRAGGNAFDAAVAVQMVLSVTEPYASGIGGGLFAMGYNAQSESVFALDGREESPKAFNASRFEDSRGKLIPFSKRISGGNSVGVPGTLAACVTLLQKHGTMSLAEVCQPAIRIAYEGFRIPAPFAANLAHHWDRISQFPKTKELFSRPDGSPLQEGDLFRNPDFAATLELIVKEGESVFYRGQIANDIVEAVQSSAVQPGILTLADLERYRPVNRLPVATDFGPYSVYGMPMPSSGGATLGLMLNLVQAYGIDDLQWGTADTFAVLIDIQNVAFADRNFYMADADFVNVPIDGLLDPDYAASRITLVDPNNPPATPIAPGTPTGATTPDNGDAINAESPTTTHFCIVDKDRNVASITSTIEQHFGSAVLVPGRGFLLNNELTDFSGRATDRDGVPLANRPTAGLLPRRSALGEDATTLGAKRPRSSMSPTIVLKDGAPYLAIGSPGGSRIIGVVFNALLNSLVFDFDLQDAVNAPRVISRNGTPEMESPLYRNEALRTELSERGYPIVDAQAAGSVQAILIQENGWLEGAADPRREGLALGY